MRGLEIEILGLLAIALTVLGFVGAKWLGEKRHARRMHRAYVGELEAGIEGDQQMEEAAEAAADAAREGAKKVSDAEGKASGASERLKHLIGGVLDDLDDSK